jgi:EAL domain-containing protein (putative c-di-GMP-specific phosphodiesterase class I)
MVSKINNSLHLKDVLLYKQPIQGRNGERYYEILARLEINGEILTPDNFLPVVTEINCCAIFDLMVVEKCARYIQRNRQENVMEKLSVNIMPASLNVQGLAENILTIFAEYAISPNDVVFEITEDQAVIDSGNALTSLNQLADAGYKLAIDDFGVRHSNFERLSVLRADILKIDGLFIKNIIHDPINHAIVASICRIAQLKKMSVVAEFVETPQYDYLYAMGVDYFQGYFIDRPALCYREPSVRHSQIVDGDSINAQ